MKARWNGRTVAESEQAVEVGGYHYFPRDAVTMELLRPSPKNDSDRACPHGVQFFDLVGTEATSERAAWSYEAPAAGMKQIDHWIGFWRDVTLEP